MHEVWVWQGSKCTVLTLAMDMSSDTVTELIAVLSAALAVVLAWASDCDIVAAEAETAWLMAVLSWVRCTVTSAVVATVSAGSPPSWFTLTDPPESGLRRSEPSDIDSIVGRPATAPSMAPTRAAALIINMLEIITLGAKNCKKCVSVISSAHAETT
jgi:hypothetical protein